MRIAAALLCVMLVALGTPMTTGAEILPFDFNSLADGASNASVQTYMQNTVNALPGTSFFSGMTVTVGGSVAEKNYSGDSHVTGPVVAGAVKPITLGTTDGTVGNNTDAPRLNGSNALVYDTFIENISTSDRITITFSKALTWFAFDWEIFPDGTCPNGTVSTCDQTTDAPWPDLTVKVNGSQILHVFGVLPGTTGLTGTTYSQSPLANPELAPQALGTTGRINLNLTSAPTTLEFIDWPRTIAIDNLQVGIVPEPGVLMLLAFGAAALLTLGRRRRRAEATLLLK